MILVSYIVRDKSCAHLNGHMNSLTLTESGFIQWCPLKTISISNLPFNKSIVFVIIDKSVTGKATSDILYIGRAKKPSQRILGGYLGGYGGKNTRKISEKLLSEGFVEKTAISIILTEKPRVMQLALLTKFAEEQGEYPSWNVKKKLPPKMKAKLSDKAHPATKAIITKARAVSTTKTVSKAKPVEKPLAVAEKSKSATKVAAEAEMHDKSKTKTEGTSTPSTSS